MKSALITGANKGIGLEITKQLAQNGFFVYLASRNLQNGLSAVEKLKAQGITNVEAIKLDVTNPESVTAARNTIGEKTAVLDVLVNNAGILGGWVQTALGATVEQFRETYEANVFGVVAVTQGFIDLLRNSAEPRIVNVSSSMGSLALTADPFFFPAKYALYQSSKSALNMYTIHVAYELRDTNFKVNVVDPGYTATDFNNDQGTGTVEEAGRRIVKYALIGKDGPTGTFVSEESSPETGICPW